MVWNPAAIVAAASRAGMLHAAVYLPATSAVAFECAFVRPDVLLLGDQRQATDYEIEYPTSALPQQLRKGDALQITDAMGTSASYRAQGHARTVGNGWFSRCELNKV